MNHIRHTILLLVAALLMLPTACTFEVSRNGDLDGMWHLQSIDTLSTGGRYEMPDYQVYWSFQVDLMTLVQVNEAQTVSCIMRFDHSDGKLRLFDPYMDDRLAGDIRIDDVGVLVPMGVNELTETFSVEQLNGSHMTLSNDKLRLKFRKF